MKTLHPLAYIIGGIIIVMALARYMPRIAGWVLLSLVLVILVAWYSERRT